MSETPKNIVRAIAGESMARNKYTFFASKARKEGFEQIAAIFEETANNEMEHAKRLMKLLTETTTSSLETYDFPIVGSTEENLLVAAAGEKWENEIMYPGFAKTATEEGMTEAATVFKEIGEVEEAHEKRYLKLAENVKNGTVFKKAEETAWKCRNCGYIHKGLEAPDKCPACDHVQAFYEVLCENY
ncbi:MAG: rubrerythrin family protein [Candidatus Berkelbacteria bacterium]